MTKDSNENAWTVKTTDIQNFDISAKNPTKQNQVALKSTLELSTDSVNINDSSSIKLIEVKLIDFGFSKVLAPKEKLYDSLGTLIYVAPEIILRDPYDNHIDVWSLGVVIYYLVFDEFPFDDQSEKEQTIALKIINEEINWKNKKEVSKDLINLLNKCLKKDKDKRISPVGVLKHKWIVQNV